MADSRCTCGKYLLALETEIAICPECGADAARRTAYSNRRTLYLNALNTYIVCAIPTVLCTLTLLTGWFVAHFVIRIRSPHWVQDGEYFSLDLLGFLWYVTFATSIVTLPVAALLIPIVIFGKYRLAVSRHGAPLGVLRIAALLSLPFVMAALLWFPIPGTAKPPLLRDLVAWIPD